jgi:hypothetical protein
VPTDYCCEVRVFVGPDSQMVYQRLPGPGPCPLVQGPTADRATFVVDHAGVVGFRVLASRDMLCSPPPQMASAPLDASTWVFPPGE